MRLALAALALITVAAGLGLRMFMDGPFAKYGGDALYTVLIYVLVLLVWPRLKPLWTLLIAVGASWVIEFAQIVGIPEVLRPVFGSTFNAPDLLWYAVGGLLAFLLHAYGRRSVSESRP
ncbi:DUF2809 domain-containing protein [Nonomuraea sp. NPDC050328]|uniref:DUF2809 domain-containing protein n=1 Tax=Nonomuraea sp. NPDC050328 TaxID=3364361 RepID=UPI0037A5DE67